MLPKNKIAMQIICYVTINLALVAGNGDLQEQRKKKEYQVATILKTSITKFFQHIFPQVPASEHPHVTISPKIKDFGAINALHSIRIPLNQDTLENLEALEFLLLHEVGHLCRIYKNTKKDELKADSFATKTATNQETCNAFIALTYRKEKEMWNKGFETDPSYPTSSEREENIKKILQKNPLPATSENSLKNIILKQQHNSTLS